MMKLKSSEDPATRNIKDMHKLVEYPVEPLVCRERSRNRGKNWESGCRINNSLKILGIIKFLFFIMNPYQCKILYTAPICIYYLGAYFTM